MIINCYFCQAQLEAKILANDIYCGSCATCPERCITFYQMKPGGTQFHSACIYFKDKENEYRANFYPEVFYIDLITLSSSSFDHRRVLQLSFCPTTITPHNIKQKFPTLKVWS